MRLGCIQRNLVHNNVLHSLHVVYNCIRLHVHVCIRLDGRVVCTYMCLIWKLHHYTIIIYTLVGIFLI